MPGRDNVWTYVLSRPARLAAQAVALTGLVAGTVAFAGFDKTVDLTVDGHTRTVHTFAGNVGDALADQGITVGKHDIVSPSLDTKVHDGTTVVVRYGRQLRVDLDGRQLRYWTTALTVAEAVEQVGLRTDGLRMSVSRSEPLGRRGLNVDLDSLKSVDLVVGGSSLSSDTYAETVGDLLAERGVQLGGLDRVSVAPATLLRDGMRVQVDRVEQQRVVGREVIPFEVRRVSSSALDKGTTKVKTAGRTGRASVVYLDTLTNGDLTQREILRRAILAAPVTRVVMVGTRQTTVATIPGGGGLNWAALARCESGGNPRAVNPAGYYGLYQFSLSTWHAMGGSGNPIDASVAEQTKRAQMLYAKAGAGQWGCGSHLFD